MAVSKLLVTAMALFFPVLPVVSVPPAAAEPNAPALEPTTVVIDVTTPPAAAPALAYLKGRTLVRRDGTTHSLPRWYDEAYELGRSTLALRLNRSGDPVVDLVASDSTVTWSRRATGVVQSDDGKFVAWIAPSGRVTVMWPDGSLQLPQAPREARPTSVSGVGRTCFRGRHIGCLVTYDYHRGGRQHIGYTTSYILTGTSPGISILDRWVKGSALLTATVTAVREHTSCSVVTAFDTRLFRTCTYLPMGFSTRGTYVAAFPSDLEGVGSSVLTVLDTQTGEPLLVIDAGQRVLQSVAWEDDSHLLVAANDFPEPTGTVMRVGIDGSQEVALPTWGSAKGGPVWFNFLG